MVVARLLAAFTGPAPPPDPELLPIDVLKYHLQNAPLAGAVVYLAAILALHQAMRRRERPLSIPRSALVLYNLVQVVINAYVAYAIAHAVGGWVFGLGVRDTLAVRHGVYLHYLCKVRTRTSPRPTAPAISPPRQPPARHASPSRLPPVPYAGLTHPALYPTSCHATPPPTCTPTLSPQPLPISTLSPPQYLDMLDTVIIVLRKKWEPLLKLQLTHRVGTPRAPMGPHVHRPRTAHAPHRREQLSFLHLYHHSSIVVVWGWVVHTPARRSGRSGPPAPPLAPPLALPLSPLFYLLKPWRSADQRASRG